MLFAMRAEIVSIGTELLLGEIVDTNSAYIASRLPSLGIDLYFQHTVGDNPGRAVEMLRRALEDNDLVITTGGLGPTEDDLTREAIAAVMGEELRIDPELEAGLRARSQRQGSNFLERSLKQAWLIPSARAIPNARGSAPGWWVEREGKIIIAMPGPPGEMTRMWEDEVAPELQRRRPGAVLITRILKTAGMGEPMVDETLSPLLKSTNPSIGVYARPDGVHVRMGAKAETPEEALAMIESMEAEIRERLGTAIWGVDEETWGVIVGQMLTERGLTLAVMESCTGGMLANEITEVPGSTRYFRGGIVSYATEVKELMGVDPAVIEEYGVISDETAQAMARAARERLQADVGIGVTGVAGPASQDGKPVGEVHIAVEGGSRIPRQSVSFVFPQGREQIKRRAVTQATILLRKALLVDESS